MAFSTRIEKVCKFRLENNVFISATEEINATELQTYIIDLVKDGLLPPQTVFYLIGGIHHGLNRDGEAIEGQTDFTLLHGFYHQVYTNASKLDSWKEKKYDFVLIPITCSAEIDYKTNITVALRLYGTIHKNSGKKQKFSLQNLLKTSFVNNS